MLHTDETWWFDHFPRTRATASLPCSKLEGSEGNSTTCNYSKLEQLNYSKTINYSEHFLNCCHYLYSHERVSFQLSFLFSVQYMYYYYCCSAWSARIRVLSGALYD